MPLVAAAGLTLIVVNGLALRAQRRYTHSLLWRSTVERVRAGHPSLVLGWQRYDRIGRALNLAGLMLGIVLVVAGVA